MMTELIQVKFLVSFQCWPAMAQGIMSSCLAVRPGTLRLQDRVPSTMQYPPACTQAARLSALKALKANGGTMPAYPGMRRRIPSSGRLLDHAGPVNNSPSAAGEGAADLQQEL